MLLNYAVDYLLLLGTVRILGLPPKHKRLAAAAAFGGLYSGACLIGGLSFLGSLFGRALSLLVISVIAFGWNLAALKRGGVFLLLSLALSGAAQCVADGSIAAVLLCAAAISLMCRFLWTSGAVGRSYVGVSIRYMGRSVDLNALRDTGNGLTDPVTGERVIVIGPEAARTLTGLTRAELADPIGTVSERRIHGLRLIPYAAVGNEDGLLLGMRFRDAMVDGKPKSIIAAMAAEGMGDHDALIGGCENE